MMKEPQSRYDRASTPIIDCDVHVYPKTDDEINRRLARPWKGAYHGESRPFYNDTTRIIGPRGDTFPPDGGRPGSDPEFLRQQHIDEFGINHAILMPRAFCNMYPNPDYASALASAFNDWMIETWLEEYNPDGVFKGSINVAQQDPEGAAREIDRVGDHPHVVQVMVDSGARAPFGQRQYYPIYEACERNGLPFAIHPGTDGSGINCQPTPGFPSTLIEWHTLLSLGFQAHLVSFLTEGVFERFPTLKVVLAEGGFAWIVPLLWRFDNHYKEMRMEVPWMTRRPLDYLADHVRITTQPAESPDNPKHLLQLLEMVNAVDFLIYSSDYPHFDFDSPRRALPKLSDAWHRRIFFENAAQLYSLAERIAVEPTEAV